MIEFLVFLILLFVAWRLMPNWCISFKDEKESKKESDLMHLRYVKKVGDVYEPQKNAKKIEDIDFNPGDIVIACHEDGSVYGVCGAVYATQVETSLQLEDKSKQAR